MRLAFAGNLLSRAHVHSLKGANGVFISLLKICHIMLDTMLVGRGSSSCVILETQQQFSLCNQAALLQLCRGSFRLWDLLPFFFGRSTPRQTHHKIPYHISQVLRNVFTPQTQIQRRRKRRPRRRQQRWAAADK